MQYSNLKRIFLSAAAALSAVAINAADASHYKTSSVLSSGRWVKIRVSESGIQQITHEQLGEWGFDDPSKVTVYGFGGVAGFNEVLDGTVPDDLPQQPVLYRDDRLLFYGESNSRPNLIYFKQKNSSIPVCPSMERNNVADGGYYFITDSQPVQQPEVIPYKSAQSESNFHWEVTCVEEEVENPFRQGQLYFGKDISGGDGEVNFSFPIEDLYFISNASTYSQVVFHNILVANGSSPRYTLQFPYRGTTSTRSLNIGSRENQSIFVTNSNSADSYIATSMMRSDEVFDVKLTYNPSDFTYLAIDRVAFAYKRYNRLRDKSEMLMILPDMAASTKVTVEYVSKGTQVWNVEDAYNVRPYQTSANAVGDRLSFTTDAACSLDKASGKAFRAIVFNPDGDHHVVEYAGAVGNSNIHSLPTPDFIILSADAFVDQAERLAQIHRDLLHQDVAVLTQGDIFNEFSSGTPSLWGIRKAMKMYYDREPGKLKYLLLFGGAYYDNRGFTTTGHLNKERGALLLNYGTPWHYEMSKSSTGYSYDGYFGVLEDTDNRYDFINRHMSISVGRLPVTDGAQAAKSVDKVYQYLTYIPTSDIYQHVLLMSDYGNRFMHMQSAEVTGQSFVKNNPGVTLTKGYTSLYPLKQGNPNVLREVIDQALKRGVMFVNYTGHGLPEALGMTYLYRIPDVQGSSYNYYPFAMLATCDAYTFDRLTPSIAQEMVFQPRGGMIAVVGSARTVYQQRNETLSEVLADVFARSRRGTTTGDIFRIARNEVLDEHSRYDDKLMVNTSCYNLCGDPAVPLYFAEYGVNIDKVNDADYDETQASHVITPLKPNVISGYVADPANPKAPLSDFNGNVMFTLHEAPFEKKLVTFGSEESPTDTLAKPVHYDQDVVVQATAAVVDGRFAVTFTPPRPLRKGDYNRVTLTAVTPDNDRVATGYSTSLVCDASLSPDVPDDTDAPVIETLYIDNPDFVSGQTTSQSFTAYASVGADESGINNATGNVGGSIHFVLDGRRNYPVVGTAIIPNGDGSIDIEYPFSGLADGRHTLTLSVSDNVGNQASRSISFYVSNDAANPRLEVAETPARVQATFSLSHNFDEDPHGRLIVEDEHGNTVYTASDAAFPYEWDLTDGKGNLVADGLYRAYAIAKGGNLYGATPKVEVLVIQQ